MVTRLSMGGLSFSVSVKVERREEYFAARTTPFALTAYGDTKYDAEQRALQMVRLLVGRFTNPAMRDYLTLRGVTWVDDN